MIGRLLPCCSGKRKIVPHVRVTNRKAMKISDLWFVFVVTLPRSDSSDELVFVVTLPLSRSDRIDEQKEKDSSDFVIDFVSDCKSRSLVELMLSKDVPVHLNSNGCEVA
mmetsp:Transcript_13537/g.14872  ORF Transcript_13537/g.14872 Transcript_13537/m.14872 type:complete len:109 (+) Transcript_13537:2458-2784(+)